MALTTGVQFEFGIQPVNPYPVDTWSGPYSAATETLAKAAANAAIPQAVRFQSMEVRLIISGTSYKYWYRDGVADANLVPFIAGTALFTGSTYPITSSHALTSSYGGFYTNLTPVPVTLGGVDAGTTFDNVSIQSVLDDLLYPYQSPAFSTFSFNQTTPIEVGDTIPSGNKTFTWSTTNSSNIQANSIQIVDTTNLIILGTGLANDGTEVLSLPSSITKTVKDSNVWTISAVNTNSITFNRTYTVNWYWKVYYGESSLTSLSESDIESLRVNILVSDSPRTYSFQANNYKYICYPTSYTLLTNFTDTLTLLNVAMEPPTTVSVTNTFGQTTNYYVHRTTNKLGSSIDIETS